MKPLTLFTVVLLFVGVWKVGNALKTKQNIVFAECDEDSYLITPPECPTEEILYFPFPYKCYQFFQCFDFEALCLRCPPGTVWDQQYTNCVPGSETNCTIVTTTVVTTPTTTTEPYTTTTEPDDPINCTINWVCPEGYSGLIRHPYDCHYYYSCNPASRPCLFKCINYLYFRPAIDLCDHPINVPDCRDGTPPPPSTTPRALGSPEE